MPDSKGRPRGVLNAARLRAAKRADSERFLREFLAVPTNPYGSLIDPAIEELREALREVAIPAPDELRRARETNIKNAAIPPLIASPDSLLRKSLLADTPTPFANDKDQFEPLNDYRLIRGRGREYKLTPHAARLAKALHEASKKKHGLTSAQVRNVVGGRFWEAFRSLDGPDFKTDFIDTSMKGLYRLRI
jgi:hypothetical protein